MAWGDGGGEENRSRAVASQPGAQAGTCTVKRHLGGQGNCRQA